MGKGSPRITIRLPQDLIDEIEKDRALRNFHSREQAWDFSDYIRAAIKELKRKRWASRGGRVGRGGASPPATVQGSEVTVQCTDASSAAQHENDHAETVSQG